MIINLNGELIHPNKAVRNLGVIFDNTMNMSCERDLPDCIYTAENYFKKSGLISQKMHASS